MKLKFILFVCVCIIVLSACRNQSPLKAETSTINKTLAEPSNSSNIDNKLQTTEKSEVNENLFEDNLKPIDFVTLLDLVGKPDSYVVSVLGEGTSMKNNDSTLINRDYTLSLFDEDVSVSLFFNLYKEEGDILEQCTINLNKADLEEYEKKLESFLGKPSETYEKSYFFTTETVTVVLANPYDDVPYIEISLNDI
ncbi:hypothetical protein LI031_19025 [Enterocloster citroniae]|uniref:hypothetical protein n=1 Tax=Enterocloster citroniae TaxID=358743 RepID=UPI001D0888DF|nr:hypothetical protein [Enterocloster citroniae]MCB7065950.1 hypothetical protein [Enterocloster citroniae]